MKKMHGAVDLRAIGGREERHRDRRLCRCRLRRDRGGAVASPLPIFEEMKQWGDDLEQFDLIVALSPASQRLAMELGRHAHVEVEYWPIMDPDGTGQGA